MTISYKWLMDYFEQPIEPQKLMLILNSIGLEVEGFEKFEEVKGNLEGLITGEVLTVEKHPNADKLSLTTVNIGQESPLQIVCGAPNVAVGQKVIVATVGTTIYPTNGDPLTMKAAKTRGIESFGMICAEDEIGLGTDHSGIKILDSSTPIGIPVASLYNPYNDHVIEIGLTPNRSDAMSHLGVARDVCSWLNHHEGTQLKPKIKQSQKNFPTEAPCPIEVVIENSDACPRYTGILIENVQVESSPVWLQQRLKAIGQRPINNIVDITNYILHDTGQPLHAFDADKIKDKKIRIKNLPSGTLFTGLDDKERKLDDEDLMICDADNNPLCMGGVFGGNNSGVSESTKNIFLESAWFQPVSIRKSSFRHLLRTDAATHFEKSVDIGQTFAVLYQAASMIADIADGKISTQAVDVYPGKKERPVIRLEYSYLQKMSGKAYTNKTVVNILSDMGFVILDEDASGITVQAPTHKTDVSIHADLVEEIMRIDGFDNIQIPSRITISPSVSGENRDIQLKEKISGALVGLGFNEMLNNSITHSENYSEEELQIAVKMLNNLSAELDTLRLSMLETGLQTVARNLNHRNDNLKLFEFGRTYSKSNGQYNEEDHLALFIAGKVSDGSWNKKEENADLYYMKGVLNSIMLQSNISNVQFENISHQRFDFLMEGKSNGKHIVSIGRPSGLMLKKFDIKSEVIYLDIQWKNWVSVSDSKRVRYNEISKFPNVQRDLSFVIDKKIIYADIETMMGSLGLKSLKSFSLFDIFESEKLGKDKRSMAMNFIFQDETKTLKDEEIDQWMSKITKNLESKLQAEIRK